MSDEKSRGVSENGVGRDNTNAAPQASPNPPSGCTVAASDGVAAGALPAVAAPSSAASAAAATYPDTVAVPRDLLNAAACAINRDRWACSREGDTDGEEAMVELHDKISLLLLTRTPSSAAAMTATHICGGEERNWSQADCTLCGDGPSPAAPVASDLLRQLVLDCQNDLATYIVPDSGISEHDVVNTLLGRLDGPQARAALGTASSGARTVLDQRIGELRMKYKADPNDTLEEWIGRLAVPAAAVASEVELMALVDKYGFFRQQKRTEEAKEVWIRIVQGMASLRSAIATTDAKDAARYRWWRERWAGDEDKFDELNDHLRKVCTPDEIDSTIDAAILAADRGTDG